jgi:flagellar biosynthetic protein FlhB
VLLISSHIDEIIGSVNASAMMQGVIMMDLLIAMLIVVTLIAMVIGLGDLLWQNYHHVQKNRMSHKELRDEAKEAEGDPHMKSQRRQRAYEIANNKMMADVPKADVVIVNPTHYAVALKWSRKKGAAPVCVAKGVDEIAARIREAAMEAGVPIHSDPPTARALHATVEIGAEIRPDHYRAVAAAIRFAERMRARSRSKVTR